MKREIVFLGADQAVSSLIGLAFSVYAAREASLEEFGVFAVSYSVYWVMFGLSRSVVGELNLILGLGELQSDNRWASYSATVSLFAGLVSSAAFAIGAIAVSDEHSNTLWSFAAAMPLVFAADAIRYTAFVEESPRGALALDVSWLCIALIATPLISYLGVSSMSSAVLGWGLGAAVSSSIAAVRYSALRPQLAGIRAWIAGRRVTGTQFAADFVAASGIGQAAVALLPLVSSLSVAGGLRAGYVITGPLNVVYAAMVVFLIPRIRLSPTFDRPLPSPAPTVLGFFAICCGLCTLAVMLLPDGLGELLLGPSWHAGQLVAPLLIVTFLLISVAQVIVQVMRLRAAAGLVFRVRLFASTLQALALCVGAAASGVVGAGTASALAALVSVGAWWIALLRSNKPFEEGGANFG